MSKKHIVLLCATQRGLAALRRLRELRPADALTVVTFPEAPGEPAFVDDIEAFAKQSGARFHVSKNVESPECEQVWAEPVDVIFMVHWRYLLSAPTLARARLAAVVFHDSLLPAYRGFSPTVWAMINGETVAGASMLHAAESFDAGDLIDQEPVAIGPDETIAQVFPRVTDAYLALLERNVDAILEGRASRQPQQQELATYTCRRTANDNRIDWRAPARRIHDLVRATTRPYSGAFTFRGAQKVTIWSAQLDPAPLHYVGSIPGRVVRVVPGEGVIVLAGEGSLLVRTVQLEGEPERCAADVFTSLSTTFE